jgi:RNA polymerase-interacting CarD/CdnL/TRCF family regulator
MEGGPLTESSSLYSIGDWIVHHSYGIGQIKEIEVKPIHGEQVPCFRVKTKDSSFWFPKNRPNNPRIRPVATPDIVQRVKKELQKPVREFDSDRKMWKRRIDEVRAGDDLIATSQMVRDLTILRTQRKLNQTEEKALSHFKDRLLREWAATMNTDYETTQLKLNNYLQTHREEMGV